MRIFSLAILTALFCATTASAQQYPYQRYPYRSCRNNPSKECQDARKAFAEHHNGMTPEQWFDQTYQGQAGRWQWENAEGDDWYQGVPGHWFQEPDSRFHGDNGDVYRKGPTGWGWIRGRREGQKGPEGRRKGRKGKEEHEHDHDHQ